MSEQGLAANVVSGKTGTPVAIVTDGTCITVTLDQLEEGAGSGKPMKRPLLEKARTQATSLLEQVVRAYQEQVAVGEVGLNGSARASTAPPLSRCPTGLLYGRIQSGKTLGMITFSALAIDNGFRVIVVLTSDNVKLVEQTAARFSALDGLVRDSTQMASWDRDATHIRKSLPDLGLVLVCGKNQQHLATMVDFLEKIGAADYPALVLDDEADQATLDTTVAARASAKAVPPKFKSTINRRTIHNDRPGESGESIGETLRHYVFVQVTATPYALLLQNSQSALKPQFTELLEPGEGYTGGEHFFSLEHLEEGHAPLVFVDEAESDELERGAEKPPAGLVAALSFFLVAAGAQAVVDPSVRARAQNFLCHTSQKRTDHERVSNLIRDYIDAVGDELRKPEFGGEIAIAFGKAEIELRRTLTEPPPLQAILEDLRRRLPRRQVIVVNSDGDNADFSRGINFIVGGNILGRGLTIDNLLVTYYLRRAKVSQMDTMLQHARMFGYRGPLMAYTRCFLPERLALRFFRIHTAEQNLRRLIQERKGGRGLPVEVGSELRATRPGVLDTGSILAYTPGQHLYPDGPNVSSGAHRLHERAKAATMVLGGTFRDERGPEDTVEVDLESVIELVGLLPYDDSGDVTWDPRAITGLLRSSVARFGGRALLYTRKMKRKRFSQGALSGDELKSLRQCSLPVLCVFLDVGRSYTVPGQRLRGEAYPHDFIYPSMVLPDGIPAHVFNVSE